MVEYLNATIAAVLVGVFVYPVFHYLVADLMTRRRRSFSLVPNRWRHILFALVRFALIGGAFVLVDSSGTDALPAYALTATLCALMVGFGASDRRLFIDADTGLISWRKITFPWWANPLNVDFIDNVGRVSYTDERYLHLFDVAKLEAFYTVNYNGSTSTSGHYRERTLRRIAERVNDYVSAFRDHDSPSAQTRRGEFRGAFLEKTEPRRQRRRARKDRIAAFFKGRKARKKRRAAEKKAAKRTDGRDEMNSKFAA